jgi:hypothetical protein
MADESRAAKARREHLEAQLDEALEESFPASDVPSIGVAPASPKKSRSRRRS